MRKLTHKLKELGRRLDGVSLWPDEVGWRRIAFSFVVLAYLGFLAVINIMMMLFLALLLSW